MDIQMPDANGIEATRRILHTSPHIGIVVVTMFEDDDSIFAAMRAGARGYILKGADQAEMLRAIRAVANGEALFSPAIAQRLMNYFAAFKPALSEVFPELTDREVLNLIAQGYTNAEDRGASDVESKDRAQSRLEHLQQIAGRRPRTGDHPRARGGAGTRGLNREKQNAQAITGLRVIISAASRQTLA
jgi:FixJ family two-component response regulator